MSKPNRLKQIRAFRTAREIAKDISEQQNNDALDRELKRLQGRMDTLRNTTYANGIEEEVKRVPYSRERFERKKSMRLALEAGLMTLIILATVSLLNQWLHFLW
jgi:hypothetical protein